MVRRSRRRESGFERAGNVAALELGLPRELSRQLLLAQAWEKAAGPAIARRAPALSIKRGVLEIEVASERWSDTLVPLLPRLAARLAALNPDLKIRKFRLRQAGEESAGRPAALGLPGASEAAVPDPSELTSARYEPPRLQTPSARPVDREHLERIAARYLERGRSEPVAR